ncbi:MAG TPA: carboxypeptidase-like regulatory domain-containing protein [Acidobacteriaceae bacterium]|nr:carboxypeptidase-like regulatory domain-containing protein [Acidobacteriaceae bacterium]
MIFRRFHWLLAFLPLCLFLCTTPHAKAQNIYATIHGTVTDTSGAVIPNAKVTALNTSTGIHTMATTDDKGYYVFPQLQTGGPYTVSVDASGFQKYEKTGITLLVNGNPEVNAALNVGSNTQTIQVAAAAVQVSTADTQLKSDITSDEVEQMPLLGRDASILEKTVPGVVEVPDRFGNPESDGAQSQQNAFTLDGVDVNDPSLQDQVMYPNPDALAEVAVVQNDLNPEYARSSGAVVSETLKSGTNAFHGDGFEFYRDTFLNNGGWGTLSRPEFHQNIYGGTLGGPIIRNKAFFFLAYQGFRNRTGGPQITSVFSPAQDAGNFSADPNLATSGANSAGLSTNPMPFAVDGCAAGTPWNQCAAFTGGTVNIPTSMWNAEAANLVRQYVPTANQTEVNGSGVTSYLDNFNTANSAQEDQGIIRLDYHPTQNDTFWASSVFQSHPDVQQLPFGGADLPGFTQVDASHVKMFNADYTHTFNATTLNDFRAGYFRFNYSAVNPQSVTPPATAGFNISPQAPLSGLPNMGLAGYFTLGFSFEGPQPRKDTNLLGSDTITKIVGNHSMKFGVLYEQFGVNNPYYSDNNGVYNYNGGGSYSSGDPAIDFVLGIPDTYTQASGSVIDAISHEYYAFAQDSWKVGRDVVLNYGIGWDAETPWANHQYAGHGITCWSLGNQTSAIYPGGPPGLQYAGDPGCTTYGQASTQWDHFAPRFGFDWSPGSGPSALIGSPGNHEFSLRGGFGLFFNRDSEEEALQNLSSPPYFFESHGVADLGSSYSPAFLNPFADVAGNGSEPNPFPYHLPPFGQPLTWSNYAEADFSNVSNRALPSYAYNMFLGVQRQLPGNMVLSVQYVGSLGRKLPRVSEGDPITAAGHAACLANPDCSSSGSLIHLDYPQYTAQPAIVPGSVSASAPNGIPWYLSVGQQLSNGASSYNSLQVSLNKAVSHGLYFVLAYTYSHALDNDSGYESSSGGGALNAVGGENGRPVNFIPGFEYLNYGSSDYDARQRLSILYNYQVPLTVGMRSNRVVNEALGGWHLSGVTALQTGFPVNIDQAGAYRNLWCDALTYYSCPDVPDWTGAHPKLFNPRTSAGHAWFDTTQFSTEPLGTFGNTPRNFFRGPGYNYTDMSLYKDFHLNSESRYIEIRLESYNVFNHANFAEPDGDFTDPTFGESLSTNDPTSFGTNAGDPQPGRATQLGGKFYF